MLKLRHAIVVEGKYDKITLSQLVDAPIFVTNGFGIFKNAALISVLRRTAETRGLIILTDSDGAGLVIRNRLSGCLPKQGVLHAFIPDVPGKERRKTSPGKAGLLGVEGMTPETLLNCLKAAGAAVENVTELERTSEITHADLYDLGIAGRPDSRSRRLSLQKYLELPALMSTNALLTALNCLLTKEELKKALWRLESSTSQSPDESPNCTSP
jgi:ribonuclease M5